MAHGATVLVPFQGSLLLPQHISALLAEKKGKDGCWVGSRQYLYTMCQVPCIWIVIDIYA